MIEIKSTERKDNRKGPWLAIVYVNDKGEEKTTNVFDKKIIEEQFKGNGKYEAQWVQNGKYWNLSSLSLVAAAPGGQAPSNGNGNGHAPAASATRATAQESVLGLKASIAIAAIHVAGAIIAAEIAADGKESKATATDIMDHAIFLSRALMAEARSFMKDKAENPGSYVDDKGQKHKPIGA